MKKRTMLLAVVLTLLLSGCAAQGTATTQPGASEPLVTSGSVSEPAESAEPADASASSESTTAAEGTAAGAPAETTSPAASPSASTQTPDKPATAQPSTKPAGPSTTESQPAAATPKPTEKPVTPAPTKPSVTPEPTPQPTEPPMPEPTDPPAPKTAYDAPYDTAQMSADAKAYGESIGMIWGASLTVDNCSWEAPSKTSSVLSGERLKTAIENGIRRVKKIQQGNGYQPGEFYFKLLLVPSGGEYVIYWLIG